MQTGSDEGVRLGAASAAYSGRLVTLAARAALQSSSESFQVIRLTEARRTTLPAGLPEAAPRATHPPRPACRITVFYGPAGGYKKVTKTAKDGMDGMMDSDRALDDEYLRIRYNIKLSDRVRELISHSSDDASMVLNHLYNRKNSRKSMLPAENELNRCNWFVSAHIFIKTLELKLKRMACRLHAMFHFLSAPSHEPMELSTPETILINQVGGSHSFLFVLPIAA